MLLNQLWAEQQQDTSLSANVSAETTINSELLSFCLLIRFILYLVSSVKLDALLWEQVGEKKGINDIFTEMINTESFISEFVDKQQLS